MTDLGFWEEHDDHTMFLRRKWVNGSREWLSGMHGSKENDKELLGYSNKEWDFVWNSMMEDGAWAVPQIKDANGNAIKENHGPEMLIKFIAHDLKCHLIVFDLSLNRIQFCSANHLKNDNVRFESPLLLYTTGGHFQSIFQINHEFFINYAKQLEEGQALASGISGGLENNVKLIKDTEKFEESCLNRNSSGCSSNSGISSNFETNVDPIKNPEKADKSSLSCSSNSENITVIPVSSTKKDSSSSSVSFSHEPFKKYRGSKSPPVNRKRSLDVSNKFELLVDEEESRQKEPFLSKSVIDEDNKSSQEDNNIENQTLKSKSTSEDDNKRFEEIKKIKAADRTYSQKQNYTILRKRIYRANQSEDKRMVENASIAKRKADKSQEELIVKKLKKSEGMKKVRAKKTLEEKKIKNSEKAQQMKELRADKTVEEKEIEKIKKVQVMKKDIPFLISTSSGGKSDVGFENIRNEDQYDIMFPPLSSIQRTVFTNKQKSKIDLMKIPTEDLLNLDLADEQMTGENSKQYGTLDIEAKINVKLILEAEDIIDQIKTSAEKESKTSTTRMKKCAETTNSSTSTNTKRRKK